MHDDERAIRELIRTWLEATAAGDANTVLSLMSDDVVFLTPGQAPFGKEAFAAASKSPKGKFRIEASGDVQEVSIAGDMAYSRTRLAVTVHLPDGEVKRRSGHTLSVFRKQSGGRWLMVRDANLLTPEPRRQGFQAAVPVLQVASVSRSIGWYRDMLGFAADPFGPPDEPVCAILRRDGVELMLQKDRGEAPSARPARSELHLDAYLRVLDVHALREAVLTKIPDAPAIETREYGCLEFSLIDLDGYVLVFGECG
jgi:uncharacterized protein (TIGR02246 family)